MQAPPTRYRCAGCGNLTRFDVVVTRTTREYHHFTVGGDLEVEDVELVDETVDQINCRWCGHGEQVVDLGQED
jgi:DNA-directed RNA polymerase subunit RPC12/RpoP